MKPLERKIPWPLYLSVLLVGGLLMWLSVARYRGYNVGMMDLGRMSQAIWSAGQGHPLIMTTAQGPQSRLALHVELFYLLLAPLYALFPTPITLLIFQAGLFVAGAFPLYAFAKRHLVQRWAAVIVCLIYLFYPVAQTAVLFDFHGDTLAMPLLFFALDALDRRAWKSYALWLALALSCKFYVALPVTVLGIVLWLQGERRIGVYTASAGVAWGLLAFFVVRPLFTPPSGGEIATTTSGYLTYYFGEWHQTIGSTLVARAVVAFIVFFPLAGVVWKALLWLLPALVVALPALLSTGPGPSYYYGYHHYALVVPFLMLATIYGLQQLPTEVKVDRHSFQLRIRDIFLGISLLLTLVFNSFFVDTPLNAGFWSGAEGRGLAPAKYGRTGRDIIKDHWLRPIVPSQTALAVSTFLAPHLANRPTLHIVAHLPEHLEEVSLVLPDALFDHVNLFADGGFEGGILHDLSSIQLLLNSPDFGLRATRDGLLLFERGLPAAQALSQEVEVFTPEVAPQIESRFGDKIGLVSASVQPLGAWRYRLQYEWRPLRPLAAEPPFIAVSRLAGVPQSRYVHLPTVALHPTVRWEPGQLVRETFEIELPPDLASGSYQLQVGWYDSSEPYAFETDERSRLGQEVLVGVLEVP